MKKYGDLEITILSCLLQKPELMEQITLEDKHFVNYQKIWRFMKVFYDRYKNFDPETMYAISNNKFQIANYIVEMTNIEPAVWNFNKYQEQLKFLYNESQKEKWIIGKVYDATMELWVRKKTTKEFKTRIEEIYKNAEEIFKEGKDKND